MKTYSEQDLIERLAMLPPPPIPPGLESRLLAAIPVSGASRLQWQRTIAFASAGAIAASALLCILWIHRDRTNVRLASVPRDVAPEYVLKQPQPRETRICDILPPLPQ